ncbi:MAG: tRNA (adenosine(37)-N6)-threonylcarbamoyltransferase complex ATPase subunit type 1 TsaE [Acidimicrobiales bacterium]|nr:tRNA (adenosine(37)-N6)-threonylcarbamoyltransferase complex ATPase subunit type 1 TsaE [Acidimicrobiales bacterium]
MEQKVNIFEFLSRSEKATEAMGEILGNHLKRGDLVVLSGGLGAGKTKFTKGIAKGLLISDVITSPTFILANTYEGRELLVHVDAYRLETFGEVDDLGLDEDSREVVTVVEWGDEIVDMLFAITWKVEISPVEAVSKSIKVGNSLDSINVEDTRYRQIRIEYLGDSVDFFLFKSEAEALNLSEIF